MKRAMNKPLYVIVMFAILALPVTAQKKNPIDATNRNVRAANNRIAELQRKDRSLQYQLNELEKRVRLLEKAEAYRDLDLKDVPTRAHAQRGFEPRTLFVDKDLARQIACEGVVKNYALLSLMQRLSRHRIALSKSEWRKTPVINQHRGLANTLAKARIDPELPVFAA